MNEKEKKDQAPEEVDKAVDDSEIIDLVDEVPPDASYVQSEIVELSQQIGPDQKSTIEDTGPVIKNEDTTIELTNPVEEEEEEEIVNLDKVLKEPIGYDSGIIEITESDLIEDPEIGTAVSDYKSGQQGILLDPENELVARQNPLDWLDGMKSAAKAASRHRGTRS